MQGTTGSLQIMDKGKERVYGGMEGESGKVEGRGAARSGNETVTHKGFQGLRGIGGSTEKMEAKTCGGRDKSEDRAKDCGENKEEGNKGGRW